jgi:N-acetylmuramoyl-L-alanine amidase
MRTRFASLFAASAPAALALAALTLSSASGKPSADLQVTAVRFWTLGDVTRVAIEVNGDFTYKRDRLNNPDRLFFDIIEARPNVEGLRFSTRQVNDKLLKQIRIAETVPGRTRVVLDLNTQIDYTVSKLENPDRLMIELRSVSASKKPDVAPSEPLPPPVSNTPAPPAVPPAPIISASVPMASPPPPSPATDTSTLAKPARPDISTALATPPSDIMTVHAASLAPKPIGTSVAPSSPQPGESATPARKSTSDGSHTLIRALGLKINRVVIDAGHGGHDVGTTGLTGLLEKDLVLDVALRLGKLIEQRMGAEVVYTRKDDTFVPLEERTAIANRNHADLFLSIHANSMPTKGPPGVETYYLNFTTASEDMDVASRENASSQKTISELQDIIQKISLHDKIDESKEFAINVQRALQANEVKYIPTTKDRGIRKAPFLVLIGAQMPSVLSEIGFLSNPREEALLKRPDHRQQIAEALYKGLSRYSDSLSHIQVASQVPPAPIAAKPDRDTPATGASK